MSTTRSVPIATVRAHRHSRGDSNEASRREPTMASVLSSSCPGELQFQRPSRSGLNQPQRPSHRPSIPSLEPPEIILPPSPESAPVFPSTVRRMSNPSIAPIYPSSCPSTLTFPQETLQQQQVFKQQWQNLPERTTILSILQASPQSSFLASKPYFSQDFSSSEDVDSSSSYFIEREAEPEIEPEADLDEDELQFSFSGPRPISALMN
eukprot:TRINITY_DN6593_c0_g2_i1.p1 TRINITY_DN6593_c0_g2~~TRINITY_DN6593_c0_g2_i1.p1  ORF type:complete len:225 (-),score=49.76 TRINITY_DN6593_c0_g2_i1:416-1039(-)